MGTSLRWKGSISLVILCLLVTRSISQDLTVTEQAEQFWTSNSCEYPPKDFYELFEDTCTRKAEADSFITGICQAYFNSSKSLCHLEDMESVDREKFISISTNQPNVDDSQVCASLSSLRHKDAQLFPKPVGDDSWFESTYDIIFSDICETACGFHHLHPLCYGFYLNYEFFEKKRILERAAADKAREIAATAATTTDGTTKKNGSSPAFGIMLTISILFLVGAGFILVKSRRGMLMQLYRNYKGF